MLLFFSPPFLIGESAYIGFRFASPWPLSTWSECTWNWIWLREVVGIGEKPPSCALFWKADRRKLSFNWLTHWFIFLPLRQGRPGALTSIYIWSACNSICDPRRTKRQKENPRRLLSVLPNVNIPLIKSDLSGAWPTFKCTPNSRRRHDLSVMEGPRVKGHAHKV